MCNKLKNSKTKIVTSAIADCIRMILIIYYITYIHTCFNYFLNKQVSKNWFGPSAKISPRGENFTLNFLSGENVSLKFLVGKILNWNLQVGNFCTWLKFTKLYILLS